MTVIASPHDANVRIGLAFPGADMSLGFGGVAAPSAAAQGVLLSRNRIEDIAIAGAKGVAGESDSARQPA